MNPDLKIERTWRAVFGLIGLGSVSLRYGLMVAEHGTADLLSRSINLFSYFTILTNVLVTAAFLVPAVAPRGKVWRWADSEGVRAAATLYAVVVAAVYHVVIRPTWDPQGWDLVADVGLHTVIPAAMVLDWMLFTPKGRLRWIDPVKWLAFPVLYGVWTILHGLVSHWWPYTFLNIDKLGWRWTLIWYAGLLAFFLIVGLVITALDRRLGRDRTGDAA